MLKKYLKKIQSFDEDRKKIIMIIGVPIVMIIVVFVWLAYADFGQKEEVKENVKEEKISDFEVFKKGLNITLVELRSLFGDLREKIKQSNSFDIEVQENIK
ncbi:hypothetical protein KJ671_02745 [Patescibacteria group bacterium]|nr:hypothetical protein [Patescibacteria group bacterium]